MAGLEVVGRPPRGVVGDGLRPVVLAAADQRLVAQVRVDDVDAVDEAPVGERLEVAERPIISAAAVGLAQHARPAELRGHARYLLEVQQVEGVLQPVGRVELEGQHVDAGHLLPAVEHHHVALVPRVGPHVLPVVAGEADAVLLAPVVIRLAPVRAEQAVQRLPVVVARGGRAGAVRDEGIELRQQVVTVVVAELLQQVLRERQAARAAQAGLVGEGVADLLAEVVGEVLRVLVVRDAQEGVRDAGPVQVDAAPAAVQALPGGGDHLALRDGRRQVRAAGQGGEGARDGVQAPGGDQLLRRLDGRAGVLHDGQPLPPALGERLDRLAAGRPGREAVLVVDVALQPQADALLQRVLPQLEPSVGEVIGQQTGAAVDEHAADVVLGEPLEHLGDAPLVHRAVPHPEHDVSAVRGGIPELVQPVDLHHG